MKGFFDFSYDNILPYLIVPTIILFIPTVWIFATAFSNIQPGGHDNVDAVSATITCGSVILITIICLLFSYKYKPSKKSIIILTIPLAIYLIYFILVILRMVYLEYVK